MKTPQIILLIVCLLFITVVKANRTYQAHDEILSAVQFYLNTHLTASPGIETRTKISRLDKRLKLSACDKPLESFSNNQKNFGSKISVGVRCSGAKPWSLYISVKIQRLAKIWVAAQPLARGSKITAADIQQVSRDISNLRGSYFNAPVDIIGKIPKQSIKLGAVFNPRYLSLPILIKRGDVVDIIAESQGLKIRMKGKAVNNGSKGQMINIKNLSSNRVIQAVVATSNLVKIIL